MATYTSTSPHGDLRQAVLRAAGELLEKEGLKAVTLRELARRAGVSHNAPYRHFPDRDSLLAALAATRGNQIRAAEMLGLNRNTLRSRIKALDIRVFRTPQP